MTRSNLAFYYADKAVMIFTCGWIANNLWNYWYFYERPHELFIPMGIFGTLFMPSFPSPLLYYSIGLFAILLILSTLFYKDNVFIRIILTFFIFWINALQWSFGFTSGVVNMLLISHLFRIFIPVKFIPTDKSNPHIYQSIQWFYLGLLITYAYSGIWKWIGLVYKLALKPDEVSWLSPLAALYNASVAFYKHDLPFNHRWIFDYPLLWQVSFLITSYILTFSFLAAFRQPLRVWAGIALILFHTVNSLVFSVHFYITPIVLACLFFPYDYFIKKIIQDIIPPNETIFKGYGLDAKYIRIYKNGEKDIFEGFYAYRESAYDKNSLIGGIYYTPLLNGVVHLIWKIQKKFQKLSIVKNKEEISEK